MGKRQDLELEAIRRYAGGEEIPAISEAIGVSENSLRKWKNRAGTEWQDARRAARQSQLTDIEDVGSRIRRAQTMAGQIMGNAKDQGSVGLILNQGLQTMILDVIGQMQTACIDPDDMGKMTKMIGNLTLALGRTEQAASINLMREKEIRKQALDDVAKKVDDDTTAGGVMTVERFKEIIRESYGV